MFKPRYTALAEEIEAGIREGRWTERLPGVAALARELNVAPRTASKAVNLLATQGKVTIRGTRGTFITLSPSRVSYHTLGVVGSWIHGRKGVEILELERHVKGRGYNLLFVGIPGPQGSDQWLRLNQMPVDGYIFTNSTLTLDHAAELRRLGVPFVSTTRMSTPPGLCWVDFDNEHGMRLAFEHLRQRGHRRIAYVSFRGYVQEVHDRTLAAYRELVEPVGGFQSALWEGEGDYIEYYNRYLDEAWRIYGQQCARRLIQHPTPPTAAIASDYRMGMGIWEEMKAHGVDVPRDFSIVGRAIHQWVVGDNPYLTHIAVSSQRKLQRAAEVLIALLEGRQTPPVQELLTPSLVPCYSTASQPESPEPLHGN